MAKMPELKSGYIWGVVLLIYIITALRPIGAPIPMSDITVEIYNLIDSLPEGSIVCIGGSGAFAFDLESSAATIPAIKHMARKGLRLVNVPLRTEAVQFEKYCVDAARVDKKFGGPWEYGKDWVQLPYIPGEDVALVSFLADVHATVSTDVYGTPLDEIPLMRELRNHEDIALWICPHWRFYYIVRYATGEHDIPSIYFAQSAGYATYSPYMMAYPGKVFMTNGWLGGAQYEKLMDMPGVGQAAIDSYAVLSAVFVAFVVLGNIRMLSTLREEEEE